MDADAINEGEPELGGSRLRSLCHLRCRIDARSYTLAAVG